MAPEDDRREPHEGASPGSGERRRAQAERREHDVSAADRSDRAAQRVRGVQDAQHALAPARFVVVLGQPGEQRQRRPHRRGRNDDDEDGREPARSRHEGQAPLVPSNERDVDLAHRAERERRDRHRERDAELEDTVGDERALHAGGEAPA